jgi:hypothetical protein
MAKKPKTKKKLGYVSSNPRFTPTREAIAMVRRPMGRPTLYEEAFCQGIVDFMAQGYSMTAYAGSIGVCKDTLVEWGRVHPAFSVAIARGKAARTMTLERELLSSGEGPVVQARQYALKNAAPDEWRDRREITGADGGPIQTVDLSKLSNDQITALENILAGAANTDAGEGREDKTRH